MLSQVHNRFLENAEKILAKISTYSQFGGAEISKDQLKVAEKKIREMIQTIKEGHLPPKDSRFKHLTRIIVDEWPLGHSLGQVISSLEEEYTRLP